MPVNTKSNLIYFSIAIFSIFLFGACKQDGRSSNAKSIDIGEFKAEMIHDEAGPTPAENQFVHFHLDMYDGDNKYIQSSHTEDFMPVVRLIPRADIDKAKNPMMELLYELSVGDTASIYIPLDSIPNPTEEMKLTDAIIYKVTPKLIQNEDEYKIYVQQKVDDAIANAEEKVFAYLDGKVEGDFREYGTGLKVTVLEEGDGEIPTRGQTVVANYSGYTRDRNNFDNSFKTGRPFTFPLGMMRVIQGWDTGFGKLKVGSKAILDIPPQLGYGEAGSPPNIKGNSDLIFYVELLNVLDN